MYQAIIRVIKSGFVFNINRSSFNKSIIKTIYNNGRFNSLQPSHRQIDNLKRNKTLSNISNMSGKEWYDLIDHDTLFQSFNHAIETKKNDQTRRADQIVNDMIAKGQYKLLTMDGHGHGRFIWSFFDALDKRGASIDHYSVELIDIDTDVTKWHQRFLPSNCKSFYGDVFNLEPKDIDNDIMVYLNFCGIGGDENIKKTIEVTQKFMAEKKPFFLSYDCRGIIPYDKTRITKTGKRKRGSDYLSSRFLEWVNGRKRIILLKNQRNRKLKVEKISECKFFTTRRIDGYDDENKLVQNIVSKRRSPRNNKRLKYSY